MTRRYWVMLYWLPSGKQATLGRRIPADEFGSLLLEWRAHFFGTSVELYFSFNRPEVYFVREGALLGRASVYPVVEGVRRAKQSDV